MQPATTSSQALQNLQSFQGQQQTPEQLLNSANTSLGVQGAQQQVTGLRQAIGNTTNLLNGVPSSILGRTANSLVTSAQANAQMANAEAPLTTKLNQQEGDYSNDNQTYEQLVQQAQDQANADLQGQQGQESYLQNIYNDIYGQEKDTAAANFAQQQLAEQQREANLSTSSSASGVSSPSLASLFGNTSSSSPAGNLTGGQTVQAADTAVRSLIDSNNAGTIVSTINAIQKSAGYGNTYDQAKLQLLEKYMPGWFTNNTVNSEYISRLGQANELKNKI